VLVVAARDDFVLSDEEDRPGAYFLANGIRLPDRGIDDLGDRGDLQAEQPRNPIAENEQGCHPERPVAEHRKEDPHDGKPLARQWYAV
jgi:hypothetical protein